MTGSVGDAGAGLELLKEMADLEIPNHAYLVKRHQYPTPRVAAGAALRRIANSCIDISDGLAADLTHILKASNCGAIVHVDRLPISTQLFETVGAQRAYELALTAGDDYELMFTVNEEQRGNLETSLASTNVKATCIGQITGHAEKLELKLYSEPYQLSALAGYQHTF